MHTPQAAAPRGAQAQSRAQRAKHTPVRALQQATRSDSPIQVPTSITCNERLEQLDSSGTYTPTNREDRVCLGQPLTPAQMEVDDLALVSALSDAVRSAIEAGAAAVQAPADGRSASLRAAFAALVSARPTLRPAAAQALWTAVCELWVSEA